MGRELRRALRRRLDRNRGTAPLFDTARFAKRKAEATPKEIGEQPLGDGAIRLYNSYSHTKDFLDCMRSRKKPICDVEIGCRSVTVCHLGNLAYWNHRRLKWDPAKEKFIGDDEANKWLDRPRRGGWKV